MKKTIATIIISLALLATSITSFWLMIDTNLQLSDVRDRLEHVKLLINDEPENLKNKEEVLANESKKYFIITSASATLFAVVVATSLVIYEKKNEKE
jgi:hypothetical protein